jgi:hypothetical protein
VARRLALATKKLPRRASLAKRNAPGRARRVRARHLFFASCAHHDTLFIAKAHPCGSGRPPNDNEAHVVLTPLFYQTIVSILYHVWNNKGFDRSNRINCKQTTTGCSRHSPLALFEIRLDCRRPQL